MTRLGWFTPTRTLLDQCGWLSVRQLVTYHSLVLVYKVKSEGKPEYLYDRLGREFSYNTRLASENGVRGMGKIKSELHKNSFIPRSIQSWNSLPSHIRLSPKIVDFKVKLKIWIKSNIEIT